MVGDVTGFGGWGNTIEVKNMKDLNSLDKKNHLAKLLKEETKEYLEWKSWCIRYNRLPFCFGNTENNSHDSFVNGKGKRIVTYLKENNNLFDIVPKVQASHVLEQFFDKDEQLVSEEINEL